MENKFFGNDEFSADKFVTDCGIGYTMKSREATFTIQDWGDDGIEVVFTNEDKDSNFKSDNLILTKDEVRVYSLVILNDLGINGQYDFYAQKFYDRIWEKWEDNVVYWIENWCAETDFDVDDVIDNLYDVLFSHKNSLTNGRFEDWLKTL